MAPSNVFIIMCMLLAINMAVPAVAKTYTVGDTSGWAVGTDYGTWASGKTFQVGDSLSKIQQIHSCSNYNIYLPFFYTR